MRSEKDLDRVEDVSMGSIGLPTRHAHRLNAQDDKMLTTIGICSFVSCTFLSLTRKPLEGAPLVVYQPQSPELDQRCKKKRRKEHVFT